MRVRLGVCVLAASLTSAGAAPAPAADEVTVQPLAVRLSAEIVGGAVGVCSGVMGVPFGAPGVIAAVLLLEPLGVYLGGTAAGGEGRFGWTLVASTLGWVGAAVAGLYFDHPSNAGESAALWTFVLGSPLAAAMLGYEMSNPVE